MNDDWRNSLQSLLDSSSLPEGEEMVESVDADCDKVQRTKLAVSIEKKGRGGKTATIVSGFAPDDDIDSVASSLKRKLATGGSARGGEILIQGERRKEVIEALRSMGYKI